MTAFLQKMRSAIFTCMNVLQIKMPLAMSKWLLTGHWDKISPMKRRVGVITQCLKSDVGKTNESNLKYRSWNETKWKIDVKICIMRKNHSITVEHITKTLQMELCRYDKMVTNVKNKQNAYFDSFAKWCCFLHQYLVPLKYKLFRDMQSAVNKWWGCNKVQKIRQVYIRWYITGTNHGECKMKSNSRNSTMRYQWEGLSKCYENLC